MTTFNWAVLAYYTSYIYRHEDQYAEAAAKYLRERIEAAFVPVAEYRQLERLHDGLQDVAQGLTARAEAAEARLREWQECALYDATMEGPVFKGWDRSALERCRKQALGGEHE